MTDWTTPWNQLSEAEQSLRMSVLQYRPRRQRSVDKEEV